MSEEGSHSATAGGRHRAEVAGAGTTTAVRLDQGHVEGDGGLPERFTDPGLPPHVHRLGDHDERAAKRAERQVAALFGISMLSTLVFVVGYFTIDMEHYVYVPGLGQGNLSNLVLGVSLGLSLLCIGLGAVHWAKTLMSDEEVVEERHPQQSAAVHRQSAVDVIYYGGEKSQIGRRPLIRYSLIGALGLFAVPLLVQVAGSLGPLPKDELSRTMWKKGLRLVRDPELSPIRADEVTIGSVYHVLPEGIEESDHVLEEKGKAAVLLIRLNPEDLKVAKARDWGYQGIVAYSKICTHVGCPVGLYEQQTHHLLCPCHQSTFDVTQDCEVVFGPAKRPLPQLKITVDAEGYLVADSAFREAVGPSFWERG